MVAMHSDEFVFMCTYRIARILYNVGRMRLLRKPHWLSEN